MRLCPPRTIRPFALVVARENACASNLNRKETRSVFRAVNRVRPSAGFQSVQRVVHLLKQFHFAGFAPVLRLLVGVCPHLAQVAPRVFVFCFACLAHLLYPFAVMSSNPTLNPDAMKRRAFPLPLSRGAG